MFDRVFAGLDEAALIAAIGRAARDEAQAGARKLAAIAELVHTTIDDDDVRGGWAYDPWNNTAAELGAALTISTRRASGQMRIAIALRDRLPRVAALYFQGRLSPRLISEITWRTHLVEDHRLLALIDTALADKADQWGPLSDNKLVDAIDAEIERHDPDAVRRAAEVIKTINLHIGHHEDPNEIISIWGQLLAQDGAALEARITAMLTGLCDNDPRDLGERRCAAAGAIIHGNTHLPCRCGSPDCPAPTGPTTSNVVISVIADPAAIDAAHQLITTQDHEQRAKNQAARENSEPAADATPPQADPETEIADEPGRPSQNGNRGENNDESETAQPETAPTEDHGRADDASTPVAPCPTDRGVALLPGVHILPIAALAEAIRGGAAIKPLWLPGPDPEPHYQPSAKLAAFVRARDLYCRFPGCDVPAQRCDIDHVVPWPYGPTHASNLNCKCRTHHLGKTFWNGWRDRQLPDGTVIWTTPAGQTYTTMPGSRLFFPTFNTTTVELPPLPQPPPDPDRTAKMPKRRRTRAADNNARIKTEREHNATQRVLERENALAVEQSRRTGLQPPAKPPPDYGNDPPPF